MITTKHIVIISTVKPDIAMSDLQTVQGHILWWILLFYFIFLRHDFICSKMASNPTWSWGWLWTSDFSVLTTLGCWGSTQGFLQAKQALSHLSHIPACLVISKRVLNLCLQNQIYGLIWLSPNSMWQSFTCCMSMPALSCEKGCCLEPNAAWRGR